MKTFLHLFILLMLSSTMFSQKISPWRKIVPLPKKIDKLLGGMIFFEAGTLDHGLMPFDPLAYNLTDGKNDTFLLNSPTKSTKYTSSSFHIGQTEVTNGQYREFINWVRDSIAHSILGHYIKKGDKQYIDWSKKLDWREGKGLDELFIKENDKYGVRRSLDTRKMVFNSAEFGEALNIYPDTLCWLRDFNLAFNEPMSANYFSHPAYEDYPVVGVSWLQALAYGYWKSTQINILLEKKGYSKIWLYLPTELQWEYAVNSDAIYSHRNNNRKFQFAWNDSDRRLQDEKGNYMANFGLITDENGIRVKDYMESAKGFLYSSKVKSFPEYNGLYDMAGNVDEWVMDMAKPSSLEANHIEFWDSTESKQIVEMANLNISSDKFFKYFEDSICKKKDEIAYRNVMKAVLTLRLKDTDSKLYLGKYPVDDVLDELVREFRILCSENKRIAKGGSWKSDLANLSNGSRRAYSQNRGYSFVGFRLAYDYVYKLKK